MNDAVEIPTVRRYTDWLDHRIEAETDSVRALRYQEDRDPFYGPEPDWCTDRVDGHKPELSAADRNHFSERAHIDATLIRGEPQGDGTLVPATIDMYLMQNVRHIQPQLWIGIGESNVGFWLTLPEAMDLFLRGTDLIGDKWAQVSR